MSEFDKEDLQVMGMVNDHATPEAAQAAEEIARDVRERIAASPSAPRNDGGYDCAPCDGEGYADASVESAEWKALNEEDSYTCGMSRKALRQERWYHIRCRLKALWRLFIIELLGYAALGGVLVAGMAKGFIPMGAAVPVFVICFMWVAVRFDRWIRGGW